ncbi:NlpC/P60 family protein [Clostridiaceae bacterium M8S5]|nr:NlpC/P60 family protein [Clostridiaceae bacterium M8S5]
MKKTLKTILTLSLVLFVLTILPTSANAVTVTVKGKIISANIPMKKELTQNSETLRTLNLGQKIEIIGQNNSQTHVKTSDGAIGWVDSNYIVPIKDIKYLKKGLITADILNVREKPSLTANILSKKHENNLVIIVEKQEDWYKILLENSTNAFLHSDYVQLISLYPMWSISEGTVNLRSSFSTDSDVVTKLNKGKSVFVLDRKDDWFKISTGDNIVGWVKTDLIKPMAGQTNQLTSRSGDSRFTTQVVNTAKQYLGVPYVYGASGPSRFDCSGFTKYVYAKLGITLPRTSRDQGNYGKYVSRNKLQAGDLVFFDTSGKYNKVISHCGIYIGGGNFIHASSTRSVRSVTISSLNNSYYNAKYVHAKRPY